MRCGIAIPDDEGLESEVDYETVGLLGPNLDIYDLARVAALNRLCAHGLDTISAGNVLGLLRRCDRAGRLRRRPLR